MRPDADPRPEAQYQRDDRNLAELHQELRVAGLGVQVLFGFLLALPFTTRFAALHSWQRDLYVADVLVAAVAIVLLVAPVAYHRIVFRQQQKEHLVRAANVLALAGLAAVALAVTSTVALLLSYVLPGAPAIVATAALFAAFVILWVAMPLVRRSRAEKGRGQPVNGSSDG